MKPIISQNIRIRYPDCFEVGQFSIVDDYCYFSTRVKIGFYSHVANNCSVGGGRERLFVLGDFSSLSAGVRVWCSSNDFANDLVTVIPAAHVAGGVPVNSKARCRGPVVGSQHGAFLVSTEESAMAGSAGLAEARLMSLATRLRPRSNGSTQLR